MQQYRHTLRICNIFLLLLVPAVDIFLQHDNSANSTHCCITTSTNHTFILFTSVSTPATMKVRGIIIYSSIVTPSLHKVNYVYTLIVVFSGASTPSLTFMWFQMQELVRVKLYLIVSTFMMSFPFK